LQRQKSALRASKNASPPPLPDQSKQRAQRELFHPFAFNLAPCIAVAGLPQMHYRHNLWQLARVKFPERYEKFPLFTSGQEWHERCSTERHEREDLRFGSHGKLSASRSNRNKTLIMITRRIEQ
jgi:hypothetical protein